MATNSIHAESSPVRALSTAPTRLLYRQTEDHLSVSVGPSEPLWGKTYRQGQRDVAVRCSFQTATARLNVKAGMRDSLATSFNPVYFCGDRCSGREEVGLLRLSFTLRALMLHVAKPFGQVVRTR